MNAQAKFANIGAKLIFGLVLAGLLVAAFVIPMRIQHQRKIDQLATCAAFRGHSAVDVSSEIDKRLEKRSTSGYLSWDDAYRLEAASVGCE
jgi:hypothetical protein